MLQLINVEVTYQNVILVVKGVSLEVPDSTIVALMGANGAGKSTVLKAISGLLKSEVGKVSDGRILLDERRIDRLDPEAISKMGIIQVLEGRQVLEHLTAEENLRLGAFVRQGRDMKSDLEMIYDYFPRLKALRSSMSGYLSGGEQQMIIMGRALMARPRYMLLDEPSMGLAPMLVREIFNIIKRINDEIKTSILLVEQNVKASLSIASYGYVMEDGRVVLDGPVDKLIDNEDIREFYLGLSRIGSRKSYREVKHYKRRKRWL